MFVQETPSPRPSATGQCTAFRPVSGDLQDELNALSKRDGWDRIAELIDDKVLHTNAVVGEPERAAAELDRRHGDLVQRLTVPDILTGSQVWRR
jgi:alkanesulfonate monooxygenase SsuD/methylene tetrahydromethanopterin reductase-like flavin-dependent oxidoreductase (luciferase family)